MFVKANASSALRYALAFNHQVAHTALSDAKSSVQQRVARWVLMTHDRVAKDDIPLIHELIASMIGIRRAAVSVVLAQLQNAGLIIIGRFHGAPETSFDWEGVAASNGATQAYPTAAQRDVCFGSEAEAAVRRLYVREVPGADLMPYHLNTNKPSPRRGRLSIHQSRVVRLELGGFDGRHGGLAAAAV